MLRISTGGYFLASRLLVGTLLTDIRFPGIHNPLITAASVACRICARRPDQHLNPHPAITRCDQLAVASGGRDPFALASLPSARPHRCASRSCHQTEDDCAAPAAARALDLQHQLLRVTALERVKLALQLRQELHQLLVVRKLPREGFRRSAP